MKIAKDLWVKWRGIRKEWTEWSTKEKTEYHPLTLNYAELKWRYVHVNVNSSDNMPLRNILRETKRIKNREKKIWIQLPSAIVLICTFPNCLIRLWAKWKSSEVQQRKFYFNLIKQIPVESSWTAHIQNNIEAREDQTFSFAHQYTTLWCIALNVHVGCCYYEML